MKLEVRDIEAMDDDAVAALAARLGMQTVAEAGSPWTASRLAKKAGVHESTIRRMVYAGRLRRVCGTHLVLIPAEEAARFLNGEEAGR